MTTPPNQPGRVADFAFIDAVLQMPFPEVVAELSSSLGSQTTAYIGGAASTKSVSAWKDSTQLPDGMREEALRGALQATRVILGTYSKNVAQAWMFGANRSLGVEAPAYRLQTASTPEDIARVVSAAWRLVTT